MSRLEVVVLAALAGILLVGLSLAAVADRNDDARATIEGPAL